MPRLTDVAYIVTNCGEAKSAGSSAKGGGVDRAFANSFALFSPLVREGNPAWSNSSSENNAAIPLPVSADVNPESDVGKTNAGIVWN